MGHPRRMVNLRRWIEALAVLVSVVFVISVIYALQQCSISSGPKTKSAEAKANLHLIQLAVERYAVDHGGEYPAYLIGGEAKFAAQVAPSGGGGMFQAIADCDLAQVSDPLLRAGYLGAYPRNPFVRDGRAIHEMQQNLATSITGDDPLRNGAPEGAALGTRFGSRCTTMGQALCDPRYPQWNSTDPATGVTTSRDSWAIVEYRFWDMTPAQRRKDPVLACSSGQFFYKSMGPPGSPRSFAAQYIDFSKPYVPLKPMVYVLGVYGHTKTTGIDFLGEERTWEFFRLGSNFPELPEFWPWTRSQLIPPAKNGSPITAWWDSWGLIIGNANGFRDGLFQSLSGGGWTDTFKYTDLPPD